jgi:hemerythrin
LRDLVATFLTQWLTRHVFGIDKDLEAFILASDRK